MENVTLELPREDAENLLRLLGNTNYYRVGAALSGAADLPEEDVRRVTNTVNHVYLQLNNLLAEPIQQDTDPAEPAEPAEIPAVKTFGPKLKECRLAAGLSQKQLAEKIGRTQVDVNRWEGGRCPNALILKRLALALGCSMDDLV